MSMRIFSPFVIPGLTRDRWRLGSTKSAAIPAFAGMTIFLTACGQAPRGEPPPGDRIACALDGAAEFAETCTLERSGPQLVVHRPDGGFRRLVIEGQGVQPLDGADVATTTPLADGGLEVAIAGDRYRIPADAPRT